MSLPVPGFEVTQGDTALVVIDPQNDFLSPDGATWGVVGQSVTENKTVDNIELLLRTAKEESLPVFISPHYYYPHDHNWRFEVALERLMHEIKMFDQVIRVNRTFSFDLDRGDFPLEPLLSNKTLVILTSSGEFGFEAGGVREHMNHLVPHIKTCSLYLGVNGDDDIHHIGIEYQEFGDDRHRRSIDEAQGGVVTLVEKLVETL